MLNVQENTRTCKIKQSEEISYEISCVRDNLAQYRKCLQEAMWHMDLVRMHTRRLEEEVARG